MQNSHPTTSVAIDKKPQSPAELEYRKQLEEATRVVVRTYRKALERLERA